MISTRHFSTSAGLSVALALCMLSNHADAEPETDGQAQAAAQLRSAVMCEDTPASLNPWGKDCSRQVAKQWKDCSSASKGRAGAMHDCLGFKRPPPASWQGSKRRVVNGRTLYMAASAIFDERDVERLHVEEQGGEHRAFVRRGQPNG